MYILTTNLHSHTLITVGQIIKYHCDAWAHKDDPSHPHCSARQRWLRHQDDWALVHASECRMLSEEEVCRRRLSPAATPSQLTMMPIPVVIIATSSAGNTARSMDAYACQALYLYDRPAH